MDDYYDSNYGAVRADIRIKEFVYLHLSSLFIDYLLRIWPIGD